MLIFRMENDRLVDDEVFTSNNECLAGVAYVSSLGMEESGLGAIKVGLWS